MTEPQVTEEQPVYGEQESYPQVEEEPQYTYNEPEAEAYEPVAEEPVYDQPEAQPLDVE